MSRVLLRGAMVVTMVPDRPDAERLDILVEGGRIAGMAGYLEHDDAETIDFSGRIIIPGLVNAHLHTWQTALRCVGADWTLLEYLSQMHGGVASHYSPEDMRIAALAGALSQINGGVTTLGDWCHNTQTPDHTDEAVRGLVQSGIRAVFLHGTTHARANAVHPMQEVDRLLKGPISSHDLLTLGMAIRGPQYSTPEVAVADFRAANERSLVVSMHQSGGRPGAAWDAVRGARLIGPGTNIVHGADLPDDWLKSFVDAGASFTVTPENELGQGHGFPITGRLMQLGAAPSLGTDVDTVVSGEILTAARIALAEQRALDHERHRQSSGLFSPKPTITCKQALAWSTVEGARALGLAHRVGRIETGMQADLVAIDARALNLWPAHDPIAAALHASIANIEAVMIAGRWRKRGHALVGVDIDQVKDKLRESGNRLRGVLQRRGALSRLRQQVVKRVVHRRLLAQARA